MGVRVRIIDKTQEAGNDLAGARGAGTHARTLQPDRAC
jgi:hypothetical protein